MENETQTAAVTINPRKAGITPDASGILSGLTQEMEKQGAQVGASLDEEKADLDASGARMNRLQDERRELQAHAPKLKTLPDRPKLEMGNWAKMAAGLFGVLAVVGSNSMRTGSVGAMNAMNGALVGLHTGNMNAYELKMAEHDEHIKNMLADHKDELAAFQRLLDDNTLSQTEVIEHAKLTAKYYGNRTMADIRSYGDVVKAVAQLATAGKKVEESQAKRTPSATAIKKGMYDKYAAEETAAGRTPLQFPAWEKMKPGGGGSGAPKVTGAIKAPAGMPQPAIDQVTKAKGGVVEFQNGKKFKLQGNEIVEAS